jgi:hypothetical protein
MRYRNAVLSWLSLAAAITGIAILLYATVQQNYRESLNDPQVQVAEDTASALVKGGGIENILWRETPLQVSTSSKSFIDIATSLSTWTAYYAEDGTPLESTGLLEGSLPRIPKGVFEDTAVGKGKGTSVPYESRITWQPKSGVRQAIVVVRVPDPKRGIGFVVSGRNMREVEDREGKLGMMAGLMWFMILLITLLTEMVVERIR